MINANLRVDEGIQIVCFHHQVDTYPYIELDFEFMDLKYAIYLDHDILDLKLRVKELNDLTRWP